MIRALIDTHILIHHILKDEKLSKEVKYILDNYNNQIYVSSASVEEAVHLFQGDSIDVPQWKSANDIIDFIERETYFVIKWVEKEHVNKLANLPYFKDHKDPFDRMIISHAMTENLTLVSGDRKFPRYTKFGLELIFND